MTLRGDLIDKYTEIIDIQKLEFFSDVHALCVFALRVHFEYKGINNDDLALLTLILKKIDNKWMFSFIHRSSETVDLSLWSRFSSFLVS